MKKILALILAIAMLGCFAACGGSGDDSTASDGEAQATSIKFSADTYEVKVDGYTKVSEGITIEPAGAKVTYEVSDENIATIDKKGEVNGIAEGTVTVTAKSLDGKVSATCTVVVKGYGKVSSHNEDRTEGGITNKRAGAPEEPDDTGAIIVIVSKKIDKSVDKTAITTLNFGTRNEDGYYITAGEGFYVTRNNDKGHYLIEDVPAGDYIGLIISSKDYTNFSHIKTYDNTTIYPTLQAKFADYLTDDEIKALAAHTALQSREYHIAEFTVTANAITPFYKAFRID